MNNKIKLIKTIERVKRKYFEREQTCEVVLSVITYVQVSPLFWTSQAIQQSAQEDEITLFVFLSLPFSLIISTDTRPHEQ